MPAKDLGTKHVCAKCGTRFYDLKKAAPICPKCGHDQRESVPAKREATSEKRVRAPARPVAPEPIEEADVEAEAEELEEGEEGEESADDDEP